MEEMCRIAKLNLEHCFLFWILLLSFCEFFDSIDAVFVKIPNVS